MTGKNKGNEFERQISKKISLWLSNNQRDDLFWRTQLSGGRYTIRKKKDIQTKNQEGDITATDPEYLFFTNRYYIECKFYKQLDVFWDLYNKKGKVYEWLNKYLSESSILNKYLLLIIKSNNKPILFISNDFDLEINISNTVHYDNCFVGGFIELTNFKDIEFFK